MDYVTILDSQTLDKLQKASFSRTDLIGIIGITCRQNLLRIEGKVKTHNLKQS